MVNNNTDDAKDKTHLILSQQDFQDELRSHIGTRRHNTTVRIQNSFSMMIKQYDLMVTYLKAPEENRDVPLDRNLLIKLQNIVDEKILIATSSMTSFLDLINNDKNWATTDYFCNLKENNNQVMKKENNAFLRKIRQYLNHYGLIPWRYEWTTDESFTFCIDPDEMLRFDGWKKSDKEILRSLGLRETSLTSIIEDYLTEMIALWTPAMHTLYSMNIRDLEQTNLMKDRAFSVLTNGNFSSAEEFIEKIEADLRVINKQNVTILTDAVEVEPSLIAIF